MYSFGTPHLVIKGTQNFYFELACFQTTYSIFILRSCITSKSKYMYVGDFEFLAKSFEYYLHLLDACMMYVLCCIYIGNAYVFFIFYMKL